MPMPAKAQIREFEAENKQGVFTHITPKQLADDLTIGVDNPDAINQGDASLCGPAAFIRAVAIERPDHYVKYALDLYRDGVAHLGKLKVEPGWDCKNYTCPPDEIAPADWITLASLRDSYNSLSDYGSADDTASGYTNPFELKSWHDKAGFSAVAHKLRHTTLWQTHPEVLREASRKYSSGHYVHLFVDSQCLYDKSMHKTSSWATHWVTLDSPVHYNEDESQFYLYVYTWGKRKRVPSSGTFPTDWFLDDLYGYVCARRTSS